jgi:hypothetical protein
MKDDKVITGQELMEWLGIMHQQVLDFIHMGLTCCDEYGRIILHGDPSKPRATMELGCKYEWLDGETFLPTIPQRRFNTTNVHAFLKENGMESILPVETVATHAGAVSTGGSDPAPATCKAAAIVPVPEGATWESLHFRIMNDDFFEVVIPGMDPQAPIERKTIGLTDKPWGYFVKLLEGRGADGRGEYMPTIEKERNTVAAHMKALRKTLQAMFNIPGDPIPNSRKNKAYKTLFTMGKGPHFYENLKNARHDDDPIQKDIDNLELSELIRSQEEDIKRDGRVMPKRVEY